MQLFKVDINPAISSCCICVGNASVSTGFIGVVLE